MLHGRTAQSAQVEALLDRARRGAGGALVVVGESGVGKSELLRHAVSRACGLRVLHARGVEGESEYPYSGLHELLSPLCGDLGGLPAVQGEALRGALALTPATGVERFAVSAGTLSLLSRAAEQGPVLLLVDDLHALDAASVEALLFAVRRLRSDPVAALLASRPEGPALRAGLPELRLAGLDVPEAAALLSERMARPISVDVVRHLVAVTEGNPLALVELAVRLTPEQCDGSVPLPDLLPIRLTAAALLELRLQALDPEARRAVLLLALDARSDLTTAGRAASLWGIDEPAFARAEDAGLVSFEPGRVVFPHPLVRNACAATASGTERRQAHRALASALAERGDPTWAWHRALAAIWPDEETAVALERLAGDAGRRSAHAVGMAALTHAARLTADSEQRAGRLLAAAEAARRAGRSKQVERLVDEALELAQGGALRAELQWTRARCVLYHGRSGAAARLLREAGDTMAAQDPARALPILGEAAFSAYLSGGVEDALALAERARALRPDGCEPEPIVELTLGAARYQLGNVAEGFEVLLSAAAVVERRGAELHPEHVAFAALAFDWLGEPVRARAVLEPRLETARASASYGVLPSLLYAWAAVHVRSGQLVVGQAAASEALDIAQDTGNRLWEYFARSCLAWAEAARGRQTACREHVEAARALAREIEVAHPAMVEDALGLLLLAHGDVEAAVAHLEPVNRPGVAGTASPVFGRPSAPDLLEAYVRAGRPVPATLTAPLDVLSARRQFPLIAALAWRCRGLLADDDEALHCFEEALRLHGRLDNPFAEARTLLCYGEALRRRGRRSDAREPLRTAREGFLRLGAEQWASRADAELRAAGHAVQAGSPSVTVTALTPQELQVALTVAAGATNREAAAKLFLSPKTIEFHLGQVYRRLGLRSRTELAALLQREAVAPSRQAAVC